MTSARAGRNVLIVDDDPGDFEMIRGMLGGVGGFDVTHAADIRSALEALTSEAFDVVLVDQRLGESTGLDLIRTAQGHEASPPMIVLAGVSHDGDDDAEVEYGAADLLVKSSVTSELLERSIRYAVRHQETLAELRRTRRELQLAEESKNEFLATVSHELRTPLSAVIGLAQVLGDPAGSVSFEDRAEIIGTIVESGYDVANLVEDLLTAARQEAGQLKVVAVPVSLFAQVNQTLETMGSTDRILIVGEAPRAEADPGRVRQILRNLLTNATKFGGDKVVVELDEHEGMARATVVDDGAGMSEEVEEAIFVRNERGRISDGSGAFVGIGLPISLDLARHMGGDLVCRREAGTTRLELTLPIHGEND